jgi:hypothetical protein
MKTAFLFLHIQNRNQSNNTTKQTKSHNFGTEIINLIAIQNNNKTFHKTTTMNQSQDSFRDLDFTTSVPTFRENRLLQEAGIDESEKQANNADVFLLYSDDEVRMRALSNGRVGANQVSAVAEGEGIVRKTRISLELHPSVLLFEDDLLLAEDEDSFHIHEVDVIRAMKENPHPQMRALASILFGVGGEGG